MTQLLADTAPIRRGLVADPKATHYRRMRQAVWLYLYLLLAANPETGRRLLALPLVARDMGLSEGTIRSWLGHLRKAGYVRVERVAGNTRVTIHRWRAPKVVQEAPVTPRRASRRPEPRITADRLAERLGASPSDPFFAEIVSTAPPGVLRETLEEVLAVPVARIRKSRAALFRYLIRQRLTR
jgi:hypothetical protein